MANLSRPSLLLPPSLEGHLLPFRVDGALHLSVLAKASFDLAPGALSLTSPEPVLATEVHFQDNPHRSVRAASDRVPYRPQADVTFVGHAYTPPGRPIAERRVRLGVHRYGAAGRESLLDKELVVRGDAGDAGSTRPFERVGLEYEHALGGAGFADNPLGRGVVPGSLPPNLLHATNPNLPGCYAPIPSSFPCRQLLLPEAVRNAAAQRVPELPEFLAEGRAFPWGYFSSAPFDQRLPYLQGNEWLVLEGLHPMLPSLEVQLPRVQTIALVAGLSELGVPDGGDLALRLDTVRIDGDAGRVVVAWRGFFDLPEPAERALSMVRVAVGVSLEGKPWAWGHEAREVALSVRHRSSDVLPPPTEVEDLGPPRSVSAPLSRLRPLPPPPAMVVQTPSPEMVLLAASPAWLGTLSADEPPPDPLTLLGGGLADADLDLGGTMVTVGGAPLPPSPMPFAAKPSEPLSADTFRVAGKARVESPQPPSPASSELRARVIEAVRNGARLSALPLAGADLSLLELAGADFSDADLTGASLVGSHVRGAKFVRACLVRARLSSAVLAEATFARASLDDADLSGADLSGADLARAVGERACFAGAKLVGARLGYTRLRGASMERADLSGVTAPHADWSHVTLRDARLAGAGLRGVRLAGASLVAAVLDEADLRDTNLEGAHLEGSSHAKARLDGATLEGATFR
jgi:uncharacterized protein YjbI with pentapeptide repeats